jgi:hypothetical protein
MAVHSPCVRTLPLYAAIESVPCPSLLPLPSKTPHLDPPCRTIRRGSYASLSNWFYPFKLRNTSALYSLNLPSPSRPSPSALTVQIIRRNQQLQTQFRRNIHIRHILALRMLLVVIKVLAHFLEYDATIPCQLPPFPYFLVRNRGRRT